MELLIHGEDLFDRNSCNDLFLSRKGLPFLSLYSTAKILIFAIIKELIIMIVIKKNGHRENWSDQKIKNAVLKSAERAKIILTDDELQNICINTTSIIKQTFPNKNEFEVVEIHNAVMEALIVVNKNVYNEYRAYRNYKERFQKSFLNAYNFANKVITMGDKENANKDSSLNSTKQILIASGIMKELMKNFELNPEWIEAHDEGKIHIHDLAERYLNAHNCNLFDMKSLLKDGFELNGIQYSEPGGVQSAFNVASDIVLSASAQQYGGFTVSYVDELFAPYAEKTYNKAVKFFMEQGLNEEMAGKLANSTTIREIEQGVQAFETKLNTVSNSLGQTPFVTISFGLDTSKWGQQISKVILETRLKGLGKTNVTAIFPKLIFLHREEINGNENSPNYFLKKLGVKCSAIHLYPDWLSGDSGFQKEVYDECGRMVSPMGCRAFLGKWYHPQTGKLVIEGRGNIGAVTLNLPMYALEADGDVEKFYNLVDQYTDMVFEIHLNAYERIGKSKGSSNPLFWCEGGAWMSVGYDEPIAPVLEGFTASLGFIGLEETCQALFQKPLKDCIQFGEELVQYLWNRTMDYKEKYGKLFTLYSTPAESLIERFQKINREKYGVIENVTNRGYMTNSFHQGVWQQLIAPEKMLLEKGMHDIAQGGRITYCEWPYNVDLATLEQNINFAMKLGLYHGINVESSTCLVCGERGEFEVCPKCGSNSVTSVNRCCGYLSFSKVKGDSRYNEGKKEEIRERVDHI